jgi:hypothetical protein
MSPDEAFADQQAANPQTWNLYAYGRNNPLGGFDPNGRGWFQDFGQGFAQTTYRPFVQAWNNPRATAAGIAYAATHLSTTLPAIGNAISNTVVAAAHGDGKAIGQIVGTATTAVVTAGAVGLAARGVAALIGTGEAAAATTETMVLAGHGSWDGAMMTLPEGTSLTIPSALGTTISDAYGNAIETGADLSPFANEMVGAQSFLPGTEAPDLMLYPGPELDIAPTSTTVDSATSLSDIVQPNQGNVCWAACSTSPE